MMCSCTHRSCAVLEQDFTLPVTLTQTSKQMKRKRKVQLAVNHPLLIFVPSSGLQGEKKTLF